MCERRVIGQRARTPHLAECQWDIDIDEVLMEEEGVQVQVQVEEEEIGETHGREQGV